MAKEDEKGEKETTPSAADLEQTGDTGAVDGQQQTTSAAEGNQDEVKGLQEAAKAEREKRQAAEEAKLAAEQQLLQMQQQAVMEKNLPQPKTTYEQAIADLGLDPDYITESDRVRLHARKDQLDQIKNAQIVNQMTNQAFINSHPDYGETVGRNNYAGRFQVSAELQEILAKKPYLTAACSTAQGAYEIVMQERRLKELDKKTSALAEHEKQQQIDAKTSVVSGSAAGGGATAQQKNAALSQNATVEEVAEMERRVKAGEFG